MWKDKKEEEKRRLSSVSITMEALHKSIVGQFVSWKKAGDFEKDYR